jgi:hypothetical protein
MKTKTTLLGMALMAFMLFSTSCSDDTEDKVEEVLGVTFTVNITGGETYKSTTGNGKMDANTFVITSDHGDKEVFLYISKFAEGTYTFDDTLNHATFTYAKSDPSKIYNSLESKQSYVKITKIHTDGVKFDGEFQFACMDANNNTEVITGSWINLSKK